MSTSTITTSNPATDQRAAQRATDRQEAARERAALTRLHAAVVAMRAWRQLAPAPTRPAADQGAGHDARPGARTP